MNTFNQTAKSLASKRKGIFLISYIAAFSFTLIVFEYACFQTAQSQQIVEHLEIFEPFIEQDQIKNIVFETPTPVRKIAKANKIIVVEKLPEKRALLDVIEKIIPSNKTSGLLLSKIGENSKLKVPKKEKNWGFSEINLSDLPCFSSCQRIIDPIERYKCTQLAISEYLVRNTNYPTIPRELGIEGTVVISFVINKKGGVQDPEIIRSVDNQIDKEAIRVIKNLPEFEAGKLDGSPVNVRFEVPIHFKLAKN